MKYLIPVIILILLSTSVLALSEQVILKHKESKDILNHNIKFLNSDLSKVYFSIDNQEYTLRKHQKGQKEDISIEVISMGNNVIDENEDYVVFLITNDQVGEELPKITKISSELTAVKIVPKDYKKEEKIILEGTKKETNEYKITSKFLSFWAFLLSLF